MINLNHKNGDLELSPFFIGRSVTIDEMENLVNDKKVIRGIINKSYRSYYIPNADDSQFGASLLFYNGNIIMISLFILQKQNISNFERTPEEKK